MYQIMRIGIEGVGHGLLMNNPAGMAAHTDELVRAGKKIPVPYDEAVSKLYIVPGGNQLYGASDWFREAALVGAKAVRDTSRSGRASMVQSFGANVFLSEPYCPLVRASTGKPITSADDEWEIFLKRAVVQGNGIMRSRPLVHDWACTVEFEYDDEGIAPAMVAAILHIAGKFPGVGDYRPGKKGPFGRFRVMELDGEGWQPS
jgi:hypothetical protein